MTCRVCGSPMERVVTTLPFKVSDITTVIIKELPVIRCLRCKEYVLEDDVMERLDRILGNVNAQTELEVVRFAA